MKKTINFNDFVDEFYKQDRQNNFSYEGLRVLFDYLERVEGETREELELDVIGLCSDYREIKINTDRKQNVAEYLAENTSVAGWVDDNTVIFKLFVVV